MNREQAILILEEVYKRRNRGKSLLDEKFPKQTQFIEDPARFKAALCTRRAGKSRGVGIYLLKTMLEVPKCNVAYIGLTRDTAKRIMWKDVLKEINEQHKLNLKANETMLSMEAPNGSMLYCLGIDKDEREMQKLLGQKFKLVVIDECASYRVDLDFLINTVIRPALTDSRGTCVMTGTPGNYARGLFFDVTTNKTAGWSVHKWTTYDNPYMSSQWDDEIKSLVTNNEKIQDTPTFKQMYLAEWFIDSSKMVYKFHVERNLGGAPDADYYNILGVDLGFEDATAFVVISYNSHDRRCYVRRAYKEPHLIISDVVTHIEYLRDKFDIHKIVVDSAAKQSVEEMRQRYGLPLTAADKTGKVGFIQIMNSEFILGNIVVDPVQSEALVEEYGQLIWEDSKNKLIEHPNCDNHLADACLYAWRYTYNHFSKPLKPKPKPEDKIDEFWEREALQIEQSRYKQESDDSWIT